jgi:phosphatidylserine/phosphatidylglycerophosphate/cardiolipin synthase-like enzyme
MSRRLLCGWCAAVLLGVCGCAPPGTTTTTTNAGGAHTSLITEPGAGDRPFIALIDSARRSVRITMYELEDQRVEQALAATASRGVHVMVLLDHGRYGAGRPGNQAAYNYLRAHNVIVAWAPTYFALVHQKSIVIDRRTAVIMTLNLTPAYYSSSRDFAVLDHRSADVDAIARVFDADLRGRQITPGAGGGDLVWSPGAQAPISALIAHAQRSIDVESEEMDDPAMTRQFCQAAQRGVRVRVVMTYQTAWRAALTHLAGCRAQVRTYPASAALYIHAKLIRVDGRTVFIGSQNLSRQSLTYNRELGIITKSPLIAASTGQTFSRDFTAAQLYQP